MILCKIRHRFFLNLDLHLQPHILGTSPEQFHRFRTDRLTIAGRLRQLGQTMHLAPTMQGLLSDAEFTSYFCLTLAFHFGPPNRFLLEFQCAVLLRLPFRFRTFNGRIILLSPVSGIRNQPHANPGLNLRVSINPRRTAIKAVQFDY